MPNLSNLKCVFLLTCISVSLQIRSQRLVLPGDYPDPSVTKIGDTYWASATTSNWAPVYPLLSSKDLITWELKGHVFDKNPEWADYYFWAPEISYENGKVYIYYSAHKKDGNLCVGIASADKPEGPYKDHGPLICQEVGSIDAFPMRDENGKLYIIWKEDGNSVGKPTPIWASEINEERTALVGEKVELFRNDAPWEANLVEGVAMVRNGEYFYAFYAAAGCCGPGCTYVTGVARSKSLLGPWEKYSKNPLLKSNDKWKCPGHGTAVEHNGRHYFLYHAYESGSTVYAGRQGLLIEHKFTPDGWVEFIEEPIDSTSVGSIDYNDAFNGTELDQTWQYSIFQKPTYTLQKGVLVLNSSDTASGRFIGQKTYSDDYTVTAEYLPSTSASPGGIAAIGDEKNMIALVAHKGTVSILETKQGKDRVISLKNVSKSPRKNIFLRMIVSDGNKIRCEYSFDNKVFAPVSEEELDSAYLPPWDRAVRAGLITTGAKGTKARFSSFHLDSK